MKLTEICPAVSEKSFKDRRTDDGGFQPISSPGALFYFPHVGYTFKNYTSKHGKAELQNVFVLLYFCLYTVLLRLFMRSRGENNKYVNGAWERLEGT